MSVLVDFIISLRLMNVSQLGRWMIALQPKDFSDLLLSPIDMKAASRYSLWLMPSGDANDRLHNLILQLSKDYGGPSFDPRMTTTFTYGDEAVS